MIKKTKHPSDRGERLALKAKKAKVHSNASPVYKLLAEREAFSTRPQSGLLEKELQDDAAKDRNGDQRRDSP